ncbi:hypothetical protein B9Z55_015018 [Caenorhabditis nigoni]|uniref:Uncharacterized protein n=2 Tax=Caenorhabditis nigoni TaxID=1611254 RepID=A0A2G5U8B5_9PELO|nr:hypothetical protein B9Z55_015018 [Caenorhabditis nigoni]
MILTFFPMLFWGAPYEHFQFDLTITCSIPGRSEFNMFIEWWESDVFVSDEQITKLKYVRAPTGSYSFSIYGAMNGDEPWSNGYAPYAVITHDCNKYGRPTELEWTLLNRCSVGQKFCHYRIIYDITDKSGSHYIHANGFRQGKYIPFQDFKSEETQITFRFPKEDY